MQNSIRAPAKASSASRASSRVCRAVPGVSAKPSFGTRRAGRASSVAVFAKKGQKGRVGTIPGQGEMIKQEPPTPEVDSDNAEFVVFVRAVDFMDEKMKVKMNASPWVPLTIVKGGQAANYLAKVGPQATLVAQHARGTQGYATSHTCVAMACLPAAPL